MSPITINSLTYSEAEMSELACDQFRVLATREWYKEAGRLIRLMRRAERLDTDTCRTDSAWARKCPERGWIMYPSVAWERFDDNHYMIGEVERCFDGEGPNMWLVATFAALMRACNSL